MLTKWKEINMKLEQQVTSLKLSKRLKELGVKQESLFEWGYHGDCLMLMQTHKWPEKDNGGDVPVSAYTVAELGELLPGTIETDKENGKLLEYDVTYQKLQLSTWMVALDCSSYEGGSLIQFSGTEADARAKCLIHLIEKGLISAKV